MAPPDRLISTTPGLSPSSLDINLVLQGFQVLLNYPISPVSTQMNLYSSQHNLCFTQHHLKLPSLPTYLSVHPIQDLLPCEKLSYWLCSTIFQGLLYPISSVPSRSTLRSSARATWLSLGQVRLWLSLEVLLLWAHPTGTSYLSP